MKLLRNIALFIGLFSIVLAVVIVVLDFYDFPENTINVLTIVMISGSCISTFIILLPNVRKDECGRPYEYLSKFNNLEKTKIYFDDLFIKKKYSKLKLIDNNHSLYYLIRPFKVVAYYIVYEEQLDNKTIEKIYKNLDLIRSQLSSKDSSKNIMVGIILCTEKYNDNSKKILYQIIGNGYNLTCIVCNIVLDYKKIYLQNRIWDIQYRVGEYGSLYFELLIEMKKMLKLKEKIK